MHLRPLGLPFPMAWQMAGVVVTTAVIGLVLVLDRFGAAVVLTGAFAGVAARAVIDGTIASSRGNATAVPKPRRKVRRGRAFLVMIIVLSSFETACC